MSRKISDHRKRCPNTLSNNLPDWIIKIDDKTYKDLRTRELLKMKEVSFNDYFGIESEKCIKEIV